MKVIITMDVDAEYADSGDRTGLTEEGFDLILEALMPFGSDIETRPDTGGA